MGFLSPAFELALPKLTANCRRPRTSSHRRSLSQPILRQKMVFPFPASEPSAPKLSAHCLRPRKSSHHNPKCYGCSGHCTAERHAKTQPPALQPPSKPPEHPDSSLKFKIGKCRDPSKAGKFEIIKPNSSANAATKHCTDSIPPAKGFSRTQEDRKRKRESARDEKGPEFSLSVSKEEILDDFLAMTGAKPPRKPAKRPKLIQKQLDDLFPGAYLSKRLMEVQYCHNH